MDEKDIEQILEATRSPDLRHGLREQVLAAASKRRTSSRRGLFTRMLQSAAAAMLLLTLGLHVSAHIRDRRLLAGLRGEPRQAVSSAENDLRKEFDLPAVAVRPPEMSAEGLRQRTHAIDRLLKGDRNGS